MNAVYEPSQILRQAWNQSEGKKMKIALLPKEVKFKDLSREWATRTIKNQAQMSALLAERHEITSYGAAIKKLKSIGRSIKNLETEFKYYHNDGSSYGLRFAPNIVETKDLKELNLLIDEDSINPVSFTELISPLSKSQPKTRPKIAIRCLSNTSNLIKKFKGVKDSVEFFGLDEGNPYEIKENKNLSFSSISDYMEQYTSLGYDACRKLPPYIGDKRTVESLLLRLIEVNAMVRSIDRQSAINHVKELCKDLNLYRSHAKLNTNFILELKVHCNLMHAYVTEEDKGKIRNALAISQFLEDDYLISLCYKAVNFSDGVAPSCEEFLVKGANYFWEIGDFSNAIYCDHNKLVWSLNQNSRIQIKEIEKLNENSNSLIPHSERISTMRQAVALSYLFKGDVHKSLELAEIARSSHGSSIHLIEAELIHLTSQWKLGYLNSHDVLRVGKSLVANFTNRSLTYHMLRAIYNLRSLAAYIGIEDQLLQILRSTRDSRAWLWTKEELITQALASMPSSAPKGKLVGHRGKFFEETALALGIGFIWH